MSLAGYWPILLLLVPVVVGVLWFLRSRGTATVGSSAIKMSAGRQNRNGMEGLLDLGGMALDQVIGQLEQAVGDLEKQPQNQHDPELSQHIVTMARSALVAHALSQQWVRDNGPGGNDDADRRSQRVRSLSEHLLDAMKLVTLGTPEWEELKRELDRLHESVRHVPTPREDTVRPIPARSMARGA